MFGSCCGYRRFAEERLSEVLICGRGVFGCVLGCLGYPVFVRYEIVGDRARVDVG